MLKMATAAPAARFSNLYTEACVRRPTLIPSFCVHLGALGWNAEGANPPFGRRVEAAADVQRDYVITLAKSP